ncbi:hypothetical protein KBD08_02370 [Candidatus Babeliales bacterium]|nr:hypothetical protein [Candidatus Babeliales bacterium]
MLIYIVFFVCNFLTCYVQATITTTHATTAHSPIALISQTTFNELTTATYLELLSEYFKQRDYLEAITKQDKMALKMLYLASKLSFENKQDLERYISCITQVTERKYFSRFDPAVQNIIHDIITQSVKTA